MRAAAGAAGAVAMSAVLVGTGLTAAAAGPTYTQTAWGVFAPPTERVAPPAVTYDEELVPSGARIRVAHRVEDGRTTVRLEVSGVQPGHTFGTHVHTDPCGPDPGDAGPHYQHIEGDNPWLANPRNEVWLDFTADAEGTGRAVAHQDWTFRPGEAGSVVLHEEGTSLGDDGREPGDAGPRAACFTVGFGHGTR